MLQYSFTLRKQLSTVFTFESHSYFFAAFVKTEKIYVKY